MSKHFQRVLSSVLVQKPTILPPVRLYARWLNRNPAKVALAFEPTANPNLKKERIIDLDTDIIRKSKDNSKEKETNDVKISTITPKKSKEIKVRRDDKLKKRAFYLNQKKVFDDNNEIIYEKLKENDSRVSSLLVKLKTKKDRIRCGQVLVEGWRLIVDGLQAKCKLQYVLFSRTEDLNNLRPFLPKTGVTFYKIPYKDIELWSDVETSPGIFGIFESPKPENFHRLSKPLPLNFVCDNIRVPGNLGAILRVAVGVGCEKVMLTKGCVDLWDQKVIRSAAGAHFRLPIHSSIEWDDMPNLLEKNTSVVVADSNAKVFIHNDVVEIEDQTNLPIPVLPYYGVQFSTMEHVTLIIGGETEGISEDSYRLAASRNGIRINIPLQRGIDSLNTGMATAVIAFEIRKQFIQFWTKAKLERQTAHAT